MKKGHKHSLATRRKMSKSRKAYLAIDGNLEKFSEAMKKVWKKKSRRDAHQNELKRRRNDSKYHEKASKSMSLAWEKEEVRNAITIGVNKAYEDPNLKKRLSAKTAESWLDDDTKKARICGIKKHWSVEENRIRQSEVQAMSWDENRKAKYRHYMKERMKDPKFANWFKFVLRSIADRSKMTKLEAAFFSFLKKNGILNYSFTGARKKVAGNRTPDFVDEFNKKAIEVYGGWHEKAKKEDVIRIQEIVDCGWSVLVVWEREIKFGERLLKKVLEFDSA